MTTSERSELWPALPLADWRSTCDTLHRLTQIVGKVRMALSPLVNHWWHVPLYVTARGLTTTTMPYRGGVVEIDFDFIDQQLRISTSKGELRTLPLQPGGVAGFYRDFTAILRSLGIDVDIWTTPVEMAPRVPFEQDEEHATYEAIYAERCWRILIQADRLFKQFRGRFLGKCSPVHFFWGAFDLAVTRFSGRAAPMYSGGAPLVHPHVMHESYFDEVISHGFWPGDDQLPYPAFYAYALPAPAGFAEASVQPAEAFYSAELGEFVLPYDAVRSAADPDLAVLDFMQSTYAAGASLAGWDRTALEARPACACDPLPAFALKLGG